MRMRAASNRFIRSNLFLSFLSFLSFFLFLPTPHERRECDIEGPDLESVCDEGGRGRGGGDVGGAGGGGGEGRRSAVDGRRRFLTVVLSLGFML